MSDLFDLLFSALVGHCRIQVCCSLPSDVMSDLHSLFKVTVNTQSHEGTTTDLREVFHDEFVELSEGRRFVEFVFMFLKQKQT